MTRFGQILDVKNIAIDIESSDKKCAFEQASLIFENTHGIAHSKVLDNLLAREKLGSTALGHGVAVPHGRIKGLKTPLATFMRLAEPVSFDAPDEQPVNLIIFLLIPDHATQHHLEILSEIAEMLSNETFRQSLEKAPNAAAIHEQITQWVSASPL